ncbi:hypothetical protein [Mucisphaera sp.]|uniref:hypothetical protein n=1 Tax=Mucisphaera sp. TaxID=2913024 RepID=UPI003D0A2895
MTTAAAVAAALTTGFTSQAQATSIVTLDYESYVGGSIKTNFGNRSAGLIRWTQDAGAVPDVHFTDITKGNGTVSGFLAFCIEAFESVNTAPSQYAVLEAEQMPNNNVGGPNPNPMGAIRADNLGKLFAVGFLGTDEDDWKVNGSFDVNYIKAFQLAVWEVVNEAVVQGMQTLNIMQSNTSDRGDFYSRYGSSHVIATTAQNLLDQAMVADAGVELIGFGSPFESLTARIQDQITVRKPSGPPPVVPTPTAAGAGLLGLGALVARRRAKA